MTDISDLQQLLQPHGLVVLGTVDPSEPEGQGLVLVGNAGSDMWSVFTSSPEFSDGAPDPLDRWTRRVGSAVAAKLGAEVVFPFEGPPHQSFLHWAGQTGQAFPSPLSIFIHQDHGLWHAYRFALKLRITHARLSTSPANTSPCLSCQTRPCLEACPVDAFSTGVYQVDACKAYLAANAHSDCRKMGCGARRACPVAIENRYVPDHARFHMEAFVGSEHLPIEDSL